MEWRFHFVHRSIEWQEETEETVFHLFVGEAQLVGAEFRVIPLDGQVTALVDDGYGISRGHIHTVEDVFHSILVGYALQVVIMQLEQFYKIGRRTRCEPVTSCKLPPAKTKNKKEIGAETPHIIKRTVSTTDMQAAPMGMFLRNYIEVERLSLRMTVTHSPFVLPHIFQTYPEVEHIVFSFSIYR